MSALLFEPFLLNKDLTLSNRIVMAPLTRRRAENDALAATDLISLHYEQRSSAGLIISEGSQISPYAYGYSGTPGCYTKAQVEAWQKVTSRVHDAGGRIFLQLWHVGPFSHRLLQPQGLAPLSASVVTPEGEVLTPKGRLPYESSRSMSDKEIKETVLDFGNAAKNALRAGFDGVEIHGAHAYLIDQFIMDGTNHRKDGFGGTIENRSRLLFMILEEVMRQVPVERVGLRLSPKSFKAGMSDSSEKETYGHIVKNLNKYNLAYLHISEKMPTETRLQEPAMSIVPYYRKIFKGIMISCGGHTIESANQMLDNKQADLIAFGKPFISNPDLVNRFKHGYPIAPWDTDTFYHGGEKGYVDYPEFKVD